jgi:hypothetical protein
MARPIIPLAKLENKILNHPVAGSQWFVAQLTMLYKSQWHRNDVQNMFRH